MSKLRVLFLIGSLRAGGSERQTVNILRFLDRSRFTPLLYLIAREGEMLAEVPADVPITSWSERRGRERLYIPGGAQFRQARDLARVLRDEQIDVLYDRTWQMTLLAGAASRGLGVRRISAAVSDPRLALEHSRERFRSLKRELLRLSYRRADCVAAASEGVRDALIGYFGLEPQRVRVVRNIIDLERIQQLSEAEAPRLEPDRFHVIFAGRLGAEKGPQYLLQATDELVNQRGRRDVCVHLLGDGPLRRELEERVRTVRLERHVRFEGYQPNPYSWMKRAQLFCLPSLYEGLPNALLEALACGVPAIAADCPHGPAEILQGGRFGRLAPTADPAALADAIEDAMLNYPEWKARAETARNFVEESFSPQAAVANLQELLLSAAKR